MKSIDADPLLLAMREGQPLPLAAILDVHGHIGAHQSMPRGLTPVTGECERSLWSRDLNFHMRSLDRIAIRHQIFSHFQALTADTLRELGRAHEASLRIVESHPSRFRAYAVMNPQLGSDHRMAMDWLDQHPLAFVGVKIHGEMHQHRLADPRMVNFWREANERAVPILLHVHPGDSLDCLRQFMEAHPRCRLILAHLWPWERDAGQLFQSFPGLFTDTSLSYNQTNRLEECCRVCSAQRVLFGSDSAYLDAPAQVAKIAFSKLPLDTKRAILTDNALAVFPAIDWR
jgi:predicted TIM-barrel fold metal-dependent hydrolase